jgi:ADP-ribose pyrophosphatase YjhB (NUDIX family)
MVIVCRIAETGKRVYLFLWPNKMQNALSSHQGPQSQRVSAHRHCHYCGSQYPQVERFPRTCPACGQMVWSNPLPVAVVAVRAEGGVLIIQRGIEPAKGKWALPGGFLETGETWQEGSCREVFEETGLRVDAADIELVEALSVAQNSQIILFSATRSTYRLSDFTFEASEETLDLRILREPEDLAFAGHTTCARKFLTG